MCPPAWHRWLNHNSSHTKGLSCENRTKNRSDRSVRVEHICCWRVKARVACRNLVIAAPLVATSVPRSDVPRRLHDFDNVCSVCLHYIPYELIRCYNQKGISHNFQQIQYKCKGPKWSRLPRNSMTLMPNSHFLPAKCISNLFPCVGAPRVKEAAGSELNLRLGEGTGNNYAYLVSDDKSKEAVIIDPANPPEYFYHARARYPQRLKMLLGYCQS